METATATIATELVEEDRKQLLTVVTQNNVPATVADGLFASFAPLYTEAKKIIAQSHGVTDPKIAGAFRLKLRRIRCDVEDKRKDLKNDYLRVSKAIDGMSNILKAAIEPVEERLLEAEQAAERAEAARRKALAEDRTAKLKRFDVDPTFYSLADMPDDVFEKLLGDAEIAHRVRIEAAAKAEADRQAKIKADEEERVRIKAENERLAREAAEAKKQREAAEAVAAAERRKADEARLAHEKSAREAAEAANRARLEADRAAQEAVAEATRKAQAEAAEAKRIADETAARERAQMQAQIAREAAERQRVEKEAAEARKREAEAEAARKAEHDARIAQEKAAKASQAEAERQKALAPDCDKIASVSAAVRALKVPEMATPEGRLLANEISSQAVKFATWIDNKSKATFGL